MSADPSNLMVVHRIEAILEKELYSTPPLMAVVVAKIIGTNKDIPKAFRATKDLSSVDLKHLRRIRDLPSGEIECILCKSEIYHDKIDDKKGALLELAQLEEKFANENLFKDFRFALVPSKAPKTDQQLKACSEIWPCKFAKSNYLIRCIEGSIFNEAERLVIRVIANCMAEYIKTNSHHMTSGSVVFRCAKIHGVGLAGPKVVEENPTKHATMISLDSVSRHAGGGHWKDESSAINKDADILFKSIQTELDELTELNDHRVDAHFLPYLCTNYDIFVTEEPCIMCTMGLVQSRIRRLFYLSKETVTELKNCQTLCYPDGAIEKLLIHREKSLNHRFEAWKITFVH